MDATWWSTLAGVVVLVVIVARNFNAWYYWPRLRPDQPPLPPGDMGWPIVGHTAEFVRAFKSANPNAFTNEYINKYGRIGLYRTHLFGQATILGTTPEAIREVLMGAQQYYTSGWLTSAKVIMGERSLAYLEGEEHRRLRKLTSASVNGTATLSNYIPMISSIAEEEVEKWADLGEINLLQKCKKFAFCTIAKVMISYDDGPELEDFADEFQGICAGIRSLAINIPGTAYYKSLQCRKRLVNRLLEVIDERRRMKKQGKDVLQVLMDAKDEETKATLTDMECVDTLLVYLVAGHESSAHTILWYMILLNEHPNVLKKVREELQAIQDEKTYPDDPITFAEYRKLVYLGRVIDEILRLVNLSPVVFRKVQQDHIVNGLTIPKGWSVESWLRAVHLDPEVFPDPLTFNPERWAGLRVKPGMFMPFGGGYRLCPGKDFARMEVAIILYHITLNYDWEPLNPKYKMKYLPHPSPVDGYPIKVTRRAADEAHDDVLRSGIADMYRRVQ